MGVHVMFSALRKPVVGALQEFDIPTSESTSCVTILSMLEAQANAHPYAPALSSGDDAVTYGELDARSNQIARYLRSIGIGNGSVAGVCLPRTIEMVTALVAIMKSGAAYLPLDSSHPRERISFILEDAGCTLLITTGETSDRFCLRTLVLDRDAHLISTMSHSEPISRVTPDQIAYVIYTSGSTGTPKGVEITHSSLLNLVRWHHEAFQVTSADRASQVAALGFDAAVWELWPYLTAGASLHLVGEDARLGPELLRDWFVQQQITIGFVPTPMAERMIALPWPCNCGLRILLTGGDALHSYPPESLPFTLVNNYGPTECTVVATSGTVPAGARAEMPPLGKAITNVCLHVLDDQLQPVPMGEVGELFIGGASVARGYVNQPALTAEKFLPDPFHAGARMYRSGDLVRQLPDGQLAFVGRADTQIKIRGYRIEPDEIAFALNSHPCVKASVVSAVLENGEKRLVAYIVPNGGSGLTRSILQEHARQRVPDYMVPSSFVLIDSLPQTSNGKIDRNLLPAPTEANVLGDQETEDPRNIIEERVAGQVAALLGLQTVGRNDNFFMLGGHSLLGTQLIARLRQAFGIDVPLRTLFAKPTVAELSEELESIILDKLKDSQ
jgi:amino acid adenylation domain-containing protein